MMSESILTLEKEGPIGLITLNRPKQYNALSQALKGEIVVALDECKHDDDIKAIIITGAGKGFCAGADLMEFGLNPSGRMVRDDLNFSYGGIIRRIVEMHKPVIAAINGPMAGAGIGLGLACDYKLMADHANLRFAFVNIGLVSDAGSTWFLAREVGHTKALEMIHGGEKVPAEECYRLGLVNTLTSADELLTKAKELATKLATKPPLAFESAKRAIYYSMTHGLYDTISFEAEEQMKLIESADHKEGVAAFIEKRTPEFKGK